jgi:hypothetical protein
VLLAPLCLADRSKITPVRLDAQIDEHQAKDERFRWAKPYYQWKM